MDKRELEQQLVAHLAKDSLILTPLNVSFTFGIDAKDAAALMAELAAEEKLVLDSGSGLNAVYRMPGRPLVGPPPGGASVKRARSSAALYHALTNLFIPGFGSLLYLRPVGFVPVLVLVAAAVCMAIFLPGWSRLAALSPLPIAWLWSIIYGFVMYAKDPWGEPPNE